MLIVTSLVLNRPTHSYLHPMSLQGGQPPPDPTPNTPSANVRLVSTQDHLNTWASPVSIPAYQCSRTLPYPLLSMIYPSDPLSLFPLLPYSCCRCTLAAAEIYSTVTFRCFSAATCLHHGTQRFHPPSSTVYLAHTSKMIRMATQSDTVTCLLSK